MDVLAAPAATETARHSIRLSLRLSVSSVRNMSWPCFPSIPLAGNLCWNPIAEAEASPVPEKSIVRVEDDVAEMSEWPVARQLAYSFHRVSVL